MPNPACGTLVTHRQWPCSPQVYTFYTLFTRFFSNFISKHIKNLNFNIVLLLTFLQYATGLQSFVGQIGPRQWGVRVKMHFYTNPAMMAARFPTTHSGQLAATMATEW